MEVVILGAEFSFLKILAFIESVRIWHPAYLLAFIQEKKNIF